MSILDIRVLGDPVLRKPTKRVTEVTDELRKLIADMFETMYAAEGIGLAAPQVGAGLRIERTRVGAVLRALDVDPAVAGERCPVTSHARRRDAIEQVDTSHDCFDQVLGEPYAHQVARVSRRQHVFDDFDHLVHRLFLFTDR